MKTRYARVHTLQQQKMASIRNPTVRSENFVTVDEIKSLFESTRVSVDILSEIDSSTEVLSTSSLWESSELDDSSVEETSTVYSGSSPSLSDIEEVSNSDETQRKSAETKVSLYFLRPRVAGVR